MASYVFKKDSYEPAADEYNRLAAKYDKRWAFYIESTAQQTLCRLNLNGDEALLDIGCGTGALLKRILTVYPKVKLSGIDLSINMLNIAREKLAGEAKFCVGSSMHLPFLDSSFDVVISCNSFHYFRVPQYALREISRVLRPKGRFIMTDWCRDYVSCRLLDAFLKLFNKSHFNTYGSKDCLQILQLSGYHSIIIEKYKINWFWGIMTVKAQKGVV